ncbi:MAG: hypothetical protein WCK49_06240 [Myxococcaceae bacterium]
MSFLERVCACLESYRVPYALVGGYAVALHGAPRGTIDLDFIVRFQEKDFIDLETAFNSIGLKSRLPVTAKQVFQFRQEYIEQRNLIAWSFVNPNNPIETVDIIITKNLFDCSTVNRDLGKLIVKVLSKKDLIEMKQESGRAQDLLDIKALERL